uniref:PNPLA domain-containing protein n=1 Tax=Palpitomonas bilix TaxID=652834 RepID=A0A7S3D0N3_9EUKA
MNILLLHATSDSLSYKATVFYLPSLKLQNLQQIFFPSPRLSDQFRGEATMKSTAFPFFVGIIMSVVMQGVLAGQSQACRSLAISGGGALGAYEAGALKGLYELHNEKPNWSKVAGISAGAIAATYLAQFNIGDEKAAIDGIIDVWETLTTDQVYQTFKRPFPTSTFGIDYLNGLLFHSGIFDTSPLDATIRAHFDEDKFRQSDRDWTVAATNVHEGYLEFFNKSTEDPATATRASSSIPGIFNSTWYNGIAYSDGGLFSMVPILEAVQPCTTEIDVLLVTPLRDPKDVTDMTTVDFYLRTFGLGGMAQVERDIALLRNARPDIKLRIVRPEKVLDGSIITFDPKVSKALVQQGYEDAKKSILGATSVLH